MYVLYENYAGLQPRIIHEKMLSINPSHLMILVQINACICCCFLAYLQCKSSGSMPENGLWMFDKDCNAVSSEKNSVF